VAVLGTQFTVFNHNARPEVVLSSGQIALTARRGRQKPLLLKPGEMAVYNAATPEAPLSKRPVQAALYSAWTSGQLDFNETPVPEIIAALQATYGIQITVRNPGLLRQKLTGSLPGNDLDGMLAALGKSLDVNVHRAGKRVSLD
jgi:ferric-dicitrate binding protein FerR (iron transport regulator)